jgi:hypothetical protein
MAIATRNKTEILGILNRIIDTKLIMTQKIRVDVKTRKRYGQPKVLEETIRIAISDIETIEIE